MLSGLAASATEWKEISRSSSPESLSESLESLSRSVIGAPSIRRALQEKRRHLRKVQYNRPTTCETCAQCVSATTVRERSAGRLAGSTAAVVDGWIPGADDRAAELEPANVG